MLAKLHDDSLGTVIINTDNISLVHFCQHDPEGDWWAKVKLIGYEDPLMVFVTDEHDLMIEDVANIFYDYWLGEFGSFTGKY